MDPEVRNQSVCLFGATGLVGLHTLKLLQESPVIKEITVFSRRQLPATSAQVTQKVLKNFASELPAAIGQSLTGSTVIWALGTTLRKAGSRERFRETDHDLALLVAREARKQEASRFILVSAAGASPDSAFFYNRIKGQVEEEVCALGFPSTLILRPSLILGKRQESRPAEDLAQKILRPLSPLFSGPLGKLRPVSFESIAGAIVQMTEMSFPGLHIFNSASIQNFKALSMITY